MPSALPMAAIKARRKARMTGNNAKETATDMIRLHGLRAQAAAQERASGLRAQGDMEGFEHWQRVHAAICELRRTEGDSPRS
jgi:hypothetical protein